MTVKSKKAAEKSVEKTETTATTAVMTTDVALEKETSLVNIREEVKDMETLPSREWANSIDMARTLDEKKMFAVQMIQSGLLPTSLASRDNLEDEDFRDKAIGAVIAVVEYGRELNITPWVALHGMHVVQGKVVMGIHMYTGLALKNNILINVVKDYARITNKEGKLVDRITEVEITRKHAAFNDMVKTYTFTKRWTDITKAELHTKDNYKKMPALMMRTRCIVEALRLYASDIFMGTFETSEMLDVNNRTYELNADGSVKKY